MFVLPYTIPSTGLCVAAIIAGAFAWPYLPELLPLVGYAVCAAYPIASGRRRTLDGGEGYDPIRSLNAALSALPEAEGE